MSLTKIESMLAAHLLEMASDKFANHGCNDFNLKELGIQQKERRDLCIAMEEWNGDQEELNRIKKLPVGDDFFDYTSDFFLMSYLSARIEEETQ